MQCTTVNVNRILFVNADVVFFVDAITKQLHLQIQLAWYFMAVDSMANVIQKLQTWLQ